MSEKKLSFFLEKYRKVIRERKKLLHALSPNNLLKRGFCIVSNSSGLAIKSTKDVTKTESLRITLIDGYIESIVENIYSNTDT